MTGRSPAEPGIPFLQLAALLIGTVLNPINSSLIATALTPIGRDLRIGADQTAWLVSSLYLVAAVGQPLMGRLADLIGPRRVFMFGLVTAAVGGVVGGLAPSIGWLILARMLIGLGTSAGYPSAMTVLSLTARRSGVPTPRPVLAAITVAGQVLAVLGPTLGGLMVGSLGWRAVFWVNVPVTALGLLLAAAHLPRDRQGPPPSRSDLLKRVDVPGVALFAVELSALLLFLMHLRSGPLYGWLVLALLSLTTLLMVERRRQGAFIDVRMLRRNTPLLLTYARFALTALITYSVFYGLPQWLQEARGFTPVQTGLILLPTSLVSIVTTLLVSRRPRVSVRTMLLLGATLTVVGIGLFALVAHHPQLWLLLSAALVLGMPWGLNNLGNQQALSLQVPRDGAGSAAGLYRTAGYLGSILSSSAIGFTYSPSATTAGFGELCWLLLGVSALLLLVTFRSASATRSPSAPDRAS
ncbi:MFS transporter [Deinococcus altitudinis]|uniref:MFS transporter n=1 Tax=Deinococcus altitudinis TaxID=468914 RepID=UPI0038915DF8